MDHTFPSPINPNPTSTTCLFCPATFNSLLTNLQHMSRTHSFFIPNETRLLVDTETLLSYLNTIINDFAQCIYCFTQRRDGEAARQHMLAKGHCSLDLDGRRKEWADFYEADSGTEDEDADEGEAEKDAESPFIQLDDSTLRLRSGQIVSASTQPTRRKARRRRSGGSAIQAPGALNGAFEPSEPETETPSSPRTPDRSLTLSARTFKQNQELCTALTHLRPSDRATLAHLPPAAQRAQLMLQAQQKSSAARAQQKAETALERKGNKTLMKFFLPTVPKRKLGQHHMSLRA